MAEPSRCPRCGRFTRADGRRCVCLLSALETTAQISALPVRPVDLTNVDRMDERTSLGAARGEWWIARPSELRAARKAESSGQPSLLPAIRPASAVQAGARSRMAGKRNHSATAILVRFTLVAVLAVAIGLCVTLVMRILL